ncbi:hypothetical protein H4582DRAFT_1515907 [Lactarius indigo]|nr:hypothetical protein H4582DRAFT_1515907 [Lactarius indigo]
MTARPNHGLRGHFLNLLSQTSAHLLSPCHLRTERSIPLSAGRTTTSNEVIAGQADCPPELTPHEYLAFSGLRSGPRLQWLNVAREAAIAVALISPRGGTYAYHSSSLAAWPTFRWCTRVAHRT